MAHIKAMEYRVIGDIHGRRVWKKLVDDNSLCIFVGDYFDPYDDISFEDCLANMKEILQYKTLHPQTKLLLGNHDTHYLCGNKERCSRYMTGHAKEIERLFRENINAFEGVVCSPDNCVLVSHAGVSFQWADRWLKGKELQPKVLSARINQLFWKGFGTDNWEGFDSFSLVNNRIGADWAGSSDNASPLWIRIPNLYRTNSENGYSYPQIVGHTRVLSEPDQFIVGNFGFADCLGNLTAYITGDELGNLKAITVK